MREHTVCEPKVSTVVFEHVDEFVRQQIQGVLQALLDEEVNAFLGRLKCQRRVPEAAAGTAPAAYRNGYGAPRRVCTASGTVTVRRPRIRGLAQRFESRVLPLFARRTGAVGELLPELHLHGLAQGDFELALRGLLGEGAPLSASTIGRLKAVWQQEFEVWSQRDLADLEVVYLLADGIYVKAGLEKEKEKAALLVVVAALADGHRIVLAVQCGHRESTESWASLLRDSKRRGMNAPRLVVADGHLALWAALAQVYPEADEQRCWNHWILNVLDRVPKRGQSATQVRLRQIMYAAPREQAAELKGRFSAWCEKHGWDSAAVVLSEDSGRLVAYYDDPHAHWLHLRTSHPVESPFASARLRTSAAKRFKKTENATAMLWKLLMVAESRFRKVHAPELMAKVAVGTRYENGRPPRAGEVEQRIAA